MPNFESAVHVRVCAERKESSQPHISSVSGKSGFLMVVREMGNDVVRLESAQLISREDALVAKDLLGRTPLQ